MSQRLPASVPAVLDPQASAAVTSLDLLTTPFVFALSDGVIANKNVIRDLAHLEQFVTGHAVLTHARPDPLEVQYVG